MNFSPQAYYYVFLSLWLVGILSDRNVHNTTEMIGETQKKKQNSCMTAKTNTNNDCHTADTCLDRRLRHITQSFSPIIGSLAFTFSRFSSFISATTSIETSLQFTATSRWRQWELEKYFSYYELWVISIFSCSTYI